MPMQALQGSLLGLHALVEAPNRTHEEFDPMKHGLRTTYINNGCRCRPCTKATTDYMREYRRRTGKTKTTLLPVDTLILTPRERAMMIEFRRRQNASQK
jgi:hypothetical protein